MGQSSHVKRIVSPEVLAASALSLLLAASLTVISLPATPASAEVAIPDREVLAKSLFAGFKQVERGPVELAELRRRARSMGLAVTPGDWRPARLPEDRNAAVEYRRLVSLGESSPLSTAENDLVFKALGTVGLSGEEVMQLRGLLAARTDLLRVAYQAANKDACDFERDWSLGARLTFPEYASMRLAARLLRAESYLLVRDGRPREAVEKLQLIHQVACHAAADPCHIGRLVAQSVLALDVAGYEWILQQPGLQSDQETLKAVLEALQLAPSLPPVRYILQGEMMMFSADMMWLREAELAGVHRLAGIEDREPPAKFSPEAHQAWLKVLAAGEADHFRRWQSLAGIAELPAVSRWTAARNFDAVTDKPSLVNPVEMFRAIYAPVAEHLMTNDARSLSRQRVVLAGAAVLGYRARHGSFPKRLADVMPRPPEDPFTDKPLRYRLEGQGFVIHNAGVTGRYAGALPQPANAGVRRGEAAFRYPNPAVEQTNPTSRVASP